MPTRRPPTFSLAVDPPATEHQRHNDHQQDDHEEQWEASSSEQVAADQANHHGPSDTETENSGERRRIGQMSSDAEDQLARMELLAQALADTRALAEWFAAEMRHESAQLDAAVAALKKSEHS